MAARDEQVAVAELTAVFEELGFLVADVSTSDDGADLVVSDEVRLQVKTSSRPSLNRLRALGVGKGESEAACMLVADRIDAIGREALERAGWGWLDPSGHIRLMAPRLQIDRQIPSLLGPDPAPADPFARASGLAVGLAVLRDTPGYTVRSLAKEAGV